MENDQPRMLLAIQCFVTTYQIATPTPSTSDTKSTSVHSILMVSFLQGKDKFRLWGSAFLMEVGKKGRTTGRSVAETARIPKKRKYAVRSRLTYSLEKSLKSKYRPNRTPLPMIGNM